MYRKSLDGVRAICVIFTIFAHIATTPSYIHGNFGVDIFFALSGFLITFLLLSETEKRGKIDLRGFYIRRIFRIIPLYFATIFLYYLATRVPGAGKSGGEFYHSLFYLLSVNGEYAPSKGVFGHSWTLGVEEKFYLLWPAVLFLITVTRRYVAVLLGCLVIYSGLCLFATEPDHVLRGYLGLSFGAVMAVATLNVESIKDVFTRRPWANFAIGGMVLCYIGLLFTNSFVFNICIGACGAILVASLWHNESQFLSKILSGPIISYFGRLTYPMYLTHVLLINAVMLIFGKLKIAPQFMLVFAITYACTILLSALLHMVVEVPLINVGRRLAKRLTYDQLIESDTEAPSDETNGAKNRQVKLNAARAES